ncbi:MAG: ABC transporter ATP-binding protein [Pyrobaculum arsenaticum]|uniref:ABC transporter ATP-binding protein n=1 Tax=Pyrobaculum arsenaticum TaxID=121277 RepID=UPI002272DD71|nr:ABC transporter ATP-binding protein [Pyrobaculum arsenaticum]
MVLLGGYDIEVKFGGVTALRDVTLEVLPGKIHAIVGPNGAGKTTLLNVFSDFIKPRKGKVLYQGRDITRIKPHVRAKIGIGRTFQKTSEVFKHMTVLEVVMTGALASIKDSVIDIFTSALWHGPYFRKEEEIREIAEEVIEFMELYEYRHRIVGSLPYGLQKKVDVARALAGKPKILLLDEPMSGLTREEREDMARYIIEINKVLGITVVLVEHDLSLVYDLADVVSVFSFGSKIAEGPPAEILKSEYVASAYMGKATI